MQMELPEGVQDLLPPVPAIQRRIEGQLITLLTCAGFAEVQPPTFELYETLRRGGQAEENLYKLTDCRGRLVALRPDFTLPVMRMALSRMEAGRLPWRVCYAGQVYRLRPAGSGRPHEYRQVGAEILGAPPGAADAEILRLAVEGLRAAGCREFRVVIGDCQVTSTLLKLAGLEEGQRKAAGEALHKEDMVGLERCLNGAVLDCFTAGERGVELARTLLNGAGDQDALAALDRLERLADATRNVGSGVYAEIDLGLVRDMDYYTGMVFEVYADSSATSLGGGGRYDKLAACFGGDVDAVGFALNVSELARIEQASSCGGESYRASHLSILSIH